MDPDVKGINLRLILSLWNIIVMMMMMIMLVIVVVVVMMIIMVVSMIVIMVMMIVTFLLIHFISLPRVLETRIFIVSMMVIMVVIKVPRTKRRERQPQHHHEQAQRDVHPVGFRFPLAFYHGSGLSPPTYGVIHFRFGRKRQLGEDDFCEENSPPTKVLYLHVTG